MRPLVIRANVSDEIQINFRNRLGHRASIHVHGLHCDVLTSDGASVGFNPDTTTDSLIQPSGVRLGRIENEWCALSVWNPAIPGTT